jgi:hypothetical protein
MGAGNLKTPEEQADAKFTAEFLRKQVLDEREKEAKRKRKGLIGCVKKSIQEAVERLKLSARYTLPVKGHTPEEFAIIYEWLDLKKFKYKLEEPPQRRAYLQLNW